MLDRCWTRYNMFQSIHYFKRIVKMLIYSFYILMGLRSTLTTESIVHNRTVATVLTRIGITRTSRGLFVLFACGKLTIGAGIAWVADTTTLAVEIDTVALIAD